MPELNDGRQVLLPLVVVRTITAKGAVLKDVIMLSQWYEWNPGMFRKPREEWDWDYILEIATREINYPTYLPPTEIFKRPKKGDIRTVVTNVYIVRLRGKQAALFRALIDAFELIGVYHHPSSWVSKLARLTSQPGVCDGAAVQDLIASLLEQAVMLHIPKVIPLGKSELSPN